MPTVVLALLSILSALPAQATPDWLLDPAPYTATSTRTDTALTLSNGLVARTWRLDPALACTALDNLAIGESMLRSVRPEAEVVIDGRTCTLGGLNGQPNHAFLLPEWLDGMEPDPDAWVLASLDGPQPISPRMEWARVRHAAPDATWPPKGIEIAFDFRPPSPDDPLAGVAITVHHALYDGLPLLAKWITVTNHTDAPVTVDRLTSEILAAVEPTSFVGGDPSTFETPNIHVETDYAFGGSMQSGEAIRRGVRWVSDPLYQTQVHYQRQTPCLLEVGPELGPGVTIAPGDTFESFRAWELIHDSTDRERQGLAVRRMYRTIAPWVTENPLMMHVRWSDPDAVRLAIDQCADVGFEMVILTFGSGFNIENDSPEYLAQMREYAEYAASRGVEIGGYSLLASRSIDAANDVIMPEGQRPTFGHSPCLGSAWGRDYFRKLYAFYDATGFMLLEHDGSYPGDECASTTHPGHAGHADSRWAQWRTITDFYKWCRARGVYLNVPDWYYLSGSTKCGMGYRETNWSLPRDQQVIHTRQNIYDGTWAKTPSMGWMFVPLTEYHGGGAAATIEPLADHLDHYERMLAGNLAMGVQACYRGPRLYDTPATRDLVKTWVDWFKANRDILESDMIHGRRADGRDVDWMLHVNPTLDTPGMLVAFNPLDHEVTRNLDANLYYIGLTDHAVARYPDATTKSLTLDRAYHATIQVTIPARAMTWVAIERP